jgi:hypothetical protein
MEKTMIPTIGLILTIYCAVRLIDEGTKADAGYFRIISHFIAAGLIVLLGLTLPFYSKLLGQ